MARYFFHFRCRDGTSVPDADGAELADVEAAHLHALALVRQTMPLFSTAAEARDWIIEVADEEQLHVLTVLFPGLERVLYRREREASPRVHRTLNLRRGRTVLNPSLPER
jgi:hypothetical protein